MPPAAAIVNIDGTLVDNDYVHTASWGRALRAHGIACPRWVIHRHMGMGGDQLVEAVAGEDAEPRHGDGVRAAEAEIFMGMIDKVTPLPRARTCCWPSAATNGRWCWRARRAARRWTATWTCLRRGGSWTAGRPPRTWTAPSPSPTSSRRPGRSGRTAPARS